MKSKLGGLYAVTPEFADRQALEIAVRQALEGGAKVVQYRNKIACRPAHIEQARALLDLCRRFGVPLIINDMVWLASEIGADGVHLGQNDLSIAQARAMLGADSLIGVSCYNSLKYALAAVEAGADYVAFGSMFPSMTKPSAVRAPLELITVAKQQISVPIAAIGGITSYNAESVIEAGADLLAVVGHLFDGSDVFRRAEAIVRILGKTSQR